MITLIDYNAGNTGSLINTFRSIGVSCRIGATASDIASASALVLPGVGAAKSGMDELIKRGLDHAIRTAIQNGVPFLGICLGMQLLFEYSEEGATPGLGILKGRVVRFRKERKVPQIGWNTVTVNRNNPEAVRLFAGIPESEFYFVNSYYPMPEDARIIAATTEYGEVFASAVCSGNIFATQFHPEKSSAAGMHVLQNFIKENL